MPCNPNPSQLSSQQIAQLTLDSEHDSVRVIMATGTDVAISLDSSDEVTTHSASLSRSILVNDQSSGIVLAEMDIRSIKSIVLHSKTLSALTGSATLTIELSPHDSDDIWISSSSITPSSSSNAIISGSPISVITRRLRIKATGAITVGSAMVYLVGQA